MDSGKSHQEPYQTKSFSQECSVASSLSFSCSLPHLSNNDVDSESVSEAGDIGDRSLRRRHSIGRSSRLSADDLIEQGTDDASCQKQEHELRSLNTSAIKPLPDNITTSPLQTKSLLSPPETNNTVETISKTFTVGFSVQ